tara:strand:- start:1490 stop:1729 length:240 start_codon:yes stop_codon:yes gene_type:complete
MSKITKEELKNLQDQEQKKGAILHDLGLLETQKHALAHMYADEVVAQEASKNELEEKYGKINISLKDGSYEIVADEEDK